MHVAFRPSRLTSAVLLLLAGAAQVRAEEAPVGDVQTVLVRPSADASAQGLRPAFPGGQVARGGRVGVLGTEDVMDTPFTVTNYTSQLIQDTQAASIGDVLLNDPSVRLARGFGNFQQIYIVRGLPVFSDDMSYNGLYGLLPRQYLAAELVERVQVLGGASAFLNGAAPGGSGLGGAIDVLPKRAANTDLNEVTLGVEGRGEGYAAADFSRRFGADKAFGVPPTAGARDGATAVRGEQRELRAFSIGADYHLAQLRLSADLGYQDHRLDASTPDITLAGGLAVPRAPKGSSQIAQPWSYSNEHDTFGTLRGEVDLSPGLTAWAAGGFRDGRERARFANPTVSADDGTSTTSRFDNARHDSIATGEIGLRGHFRTGPVSHAVVTSLDLYSAGSKNAYAVSGSSAAGSIYDPTFIAMPAAPFTGGQLDDPQTTARTRTNSLSLADTLGFLQDRVLVTLGARRQRIASAAYDYNTGAPAANGAYTAARVTPVGGVVFKASRQVSVYATYVEGLVAGDIAPQKTPDGQHDIVNHDEVFKPYQTRQAEVGAKFDLGRMGGAVSVFQARKPVASIDSDYVFGVKDTQRNRGAQLSFYGEPAAGLTLLGGASFLDARLDGAQAIGTPRSQFNLGADWRVPAASGLALTARLVHTASQYADADNTQRLPSWSRVDLGARYAMDLGRQTLTLRARVDNVANRGYWASAGGYPGAGYLVVGAPRTFVFSGTLGF